MSTGILMFLYGFRRFVNKICFLPVRKIFYAAAFFKACAELNIRMVGFWVNGAFEQKLHRFHTHLF